MTPITPAEAIKLKGEILPPEVISAWNNTIATFFDGRKAEIKQNVIVNLLAQVMHVERHVVFERKWLDIEALYRQHGWKVTYDKPAYNESYEAFFLFEVE